MKRCKAKTLLFSTTEDDIHLILKVLIIKKLQEKGYRAVSEATLVDRVNNRTKTVDVLDDQNRICYEIQKNPTKKYIAAQKDFAKGLGAHSIVINLKQFVGQEFTDEVERLVKKINDELIV